MVVVALFVGSGLRSRDGRGDRAVLDIIRRNGPFGCRETNSWRVLGDCNHWSCRARPRECSVTSAKPSSRAGRQHFLVVLEVTYCCLEDTFITPVRVCSLVTSRNFVSVALRLTILYCRESSGWREQLDFVVHIAHSDPFEAAHWGRTSVGLAVTALRWRCACLQFATLGVCGLRVV